MANRFGAYQAARARDKNLHRALISQYLRVDILFSLCGVAWAPQVSIRNQTSRAGQSRHKSGRMAQRRGVLVSLLMRFRRRVRAASIIPDR